MIGLLHTFNVELRFLIGANNYELLKMTLLWTCGQLSSFCWRDDNNFFTGRVSLSQGKHGSATLNNNISPKWTDYCVTGAWFCCGSDLLFGIVLSILVYFHIFLFYMRTQYNGILLAWTLNKNIFLKLTCSDMFAYHKLHVYFVQMPRTIWNPNQ